MKHQRGSGINKRFVLVAVERGRKVRVDSRDAHGVKDMRTNSYPSLDRNMTVMRAKFSANILRGRNYRRNVKVSYYGWRYANAA